MYRECMAYISGSYLCQFYDLRFRRDRSDKIKATIVNLLLLYINAMKNVLKLTTILSVVRRLFLVPIAAAVVSNSRAVLFCHFLPYSSAFS